MSEDEAHEDEQQGSSEAEPEQPEADDPDTGDDAPDGAGDGDEAAGEPVAVTTGTSTANVTPEEWERRWTKAERRFASYEKAIREIWEDDADALIAFPLDPTSPPGFVNMANAGFVDDETKAAALVFLGYTREQEFEPDPLTRECATCKGKGKTATGSHVAGKESRACPTCKGYGAEGLAPSGATEATNGHADAPFTLAEATTADAPERDEWGEPVVLPDGRENPNYGRMPHRKVLVEPYGVTANLGVQDAQVEA